VTVNAALSSAIAFLLIGVSGTPGCARHEQFDRAYALSELKSVVVDVAANIDILFFKNDDLAGNRQWIYISSTSPITGNQGLRSSHSTQVTEKVPAESLLSYALTVGVPESSLSAPKEPFGEMVETQVNGGSLRLRSIRLENGFLCVVELLP